MSVKQYKKHSDVPRRYRWDLEKLLNGQTIESAIEKLLDFKQKLIKVKDTKYDSSQAYLQALKIEDEMNILKNKILNYIQNHISLNVVSERYNALDQDLRFKLYQLDQELGSEDVRFFAHLKQLKLWVQDSKFDSYRHLIEAKIEAKKHQLPKAIQEFYVKASRADVDVEEIFSILTNSELDYGFATSSSGKKIKVTLANYWFLAKHRDHQVRKTSIQAFRKAFLKHKGTLANLLYQHFKKITTWTKLQKFKTPIEGLIFEDRVSEKLLTTLYEQVQKHLPIFKKFDRYKRRFYQAKFNKPMTKYDHHVELVKVKNNYTIEEAQKIVLNSVKPFGKEYSEVVKKAFSERWVDYMNVNNKRSGAYSIALSYGLDQKLILMNFDGQLQSISTLAHEMGHSMHSYFADQALDVRNSQYPIFLAEIASIFNELMLSDYLQKKLDNKKAKFKILQTQIEGFMGTVLHQVEWSNYEYEMYNAIAQGQPLSTYEAIAKLYYKNHQKYALKLEKYKSDNQFGAIYVPHYYYRFYVYKYAIGQLCASIFFQRYKEHGAEELAKYIQKFLAAGGSKWPLEILQDSGINLEDPQVYGIGFKALEQIVEQWIKLGKEIFKI